MMVDYFLFLAQINQKLFLFCLTRPPSNLISQWQQTSRLQAMAPPTLTSQMVCHCKTSCHHQIRHAMPNIEYSAISLPKGLDIFLSEEKKSVEYSTKCHRKASKNM